MKVSAVTLLLATAMFASLATAAPPRGGFQRFRSFSQRQVEGAPEEPEVPPYPPSGWKPEKPFYLPGEEVTTEADSEVLTTTTEPSAETTTTTLEDETEPEAAPSIPVDARNKLILPRLTEPNYYVLLPQQQPQQSPQRSSYQFLIPDYSSPVNNAYVLRDVEAFGAPIYYFGDQGGLLVQLADRR